MRNLSVRSSFAALALSLVAGCSGALSGTPTGETSESLVARPSARLFLTDAVLSRLAARAQAGDASWSALAAKCDGWAGGTMYAPNGQAYPNFPDVGQGYQGEEYVPPMMSLGLCYRVAAAAGMTAAAGRYAAGGTRLLDAISTPVSSGGQAPSTDSGYGIRNYGVAMAFGFDWLYPALSAGSRARAIASLNTWVDWYDTSGFSRDQPIGNYFAGYLLAKTATAVATEGDNANAGAYWSDVSTHLYGELVKPAFSKSMSGGGWPEGWEYGPHAVRSIAEFLWIAKTAKGTTWFDDVPQVRDQANFLRYFAWPSLKHMDDQGTVRSGVNIAPSAALAGELAGILGYVGDPSAGLARSFAADVAGVADDSAPWQSFLFVDGTLAKSDYTARPLSWLAAGPGQFAARASWAKDAVWGTLTAGPYINAPDSGEQLFGQGSVAVVRGDQPILVNATGAIPTLSGPTGEDFVYADSWGQRTRKLYNTFFVADSANQYSPGQSSADPTSTTTHLERYDDAGGFVRARGAGIEGMYKAGVVKQFTRDSVFLRSGTFVFFDRTTAANAGDDQWLAFHTQRAPSAALTADSTQKRFDVKDASGGTVGSIRLLLPRGGSPSTVALPGGVTRLENHSTGAAQDWLTVVSATGAPAEQVRISNADGNVLVGSLTGVLLQGGRNQVVLFPGDHAATGSSSAVRYVVGQTADCDHVLVDMTPSSSGYAVTASVAGGKVTVDVKPGGPFQPTAGGNLSFAVSPAGAVSPTGWKTVQGGGVVPPPPSSAGGAPPPPKGGGAAPSAAPAAPPPPIGGGTSTVFQAPATDVSITSMNENSGNVDGTTFRTGDRDYAYVSSADHYTAKTLMTFDLSSLPKSAHVTSATLGVTVECWESGASLTGNYLGESWTPASVGWTHRSSDGTAWTQPGVGRADERGAAFSIGGLTAAGNQRKTVSIDPAEVQSWINSANDGIVLSNPTNGTLRVASSRASAAADRPILTVTYTP